MSESENGLPAHEAGHDQRRHPSGGRAADRGRPGAPTHRRTLGPRSAASRRRARPRSATPGRHRPGRPPRTGARAGAIAPGRDRPDRRPAAAPAAARPARARGRTGAAEPRGRRRGRARSGEAVEAGGAARGGRAPARRAGAQGPPVGRYLMCVHVQPHATQIAMLEGRSLVEHYVSRASDDTTQIDGNIYRGRVQNVLPGMEAAFVDIGTPKNAVLYRGDVRYDRDDVEGGASQGSAPDRADAASRARPSSARSPRTPSGPRAPGSPRRSRCPAASSSWCPTPAPSASPSASTTTSAGGCAGSSTRSGPPGHGLIVRTAAEGASRGRAAPRRRAACSDQWEAIEAEAAALQRPRPALPRARPGRADPARGAQQRVPRGHHRRRRPLRAGPGLRGHGQPRAGRAGRVLRPRGRAACPSSSATTSTSSSTRPSTARSGCRRGGRSSSSAPRRSPSST